VIEFMRSETVVFFSLLIVFLLFVAICYVVSHARKRYLELEGQIKKFVASQGVFLGLEASLSQLHALEKIHLLNVHQKLAHEVEELLGALWIDIETALKQFAPSNYVGEQSFSVLTVLGGFELYKKMQLDFIGHSNAGEKSFAQHMLNFQGRDLRESLDSVLKSGRESSFKHLFSKYKVYGVLDFAWAVYPVILILLSFATFFGVYAFH
jgi:hypothetical protein